MMTGVPNNDTTWSFSFVPESRKECAVLPMWLYCVTFSGPRPKPGAVGEVEETKPPQGAPGSGGQVSHSENSSQAC